MDTWPGEDVAGMRFAIKTRPEHQTWEEIRTNQQIITCSSCGRILYYDPANEPPPEPPTNRKKSKAPSTPVETETQAENEPAAETAPAQQ